MVTGPKSARHYPALHMIRQAIECLVFKDCLAELYHVNKGCWLVNFNLSR